MLVVGSTLASEPSGRSSPTPTARSSGHPIPSSGRRHRISTVGSLDARPGARSALEGIARRKPKLAALDRRAANLRRESIHTLTTRLTRRYGTIVVEDLDIAAMARGMRRRAFRRSVHAAGLGQIRPTMPYKSGWGGCALVVADRWFASSKIHHECGGYHPDLKLADRRWVCPRCGGLVDRNANAARNLRDWTGPVTDRDVQRGGVAAPVPIVGDHDGQAHAAAWVCEASEDHRAVAEADDTRTEPHPGARNPAQGCQERSDTDAR
jgi:IS605 OrfB family transposase